MKQTYKYIGIGLIVFGVLIGTSWYFYRDLSEWSHVVTEKIRGIFTEKSLQSYESKGVRRQISYLGRLREAEKLIGHDYYGLASVELQKAITEKPDLIEPYVMLGEVYVRQQDFPKLQNLIDTIAQKFPNSGEDIVLTARKLIAEERFADAIALLKSAPEFSAEFPPNVRFYHAILLALQNDHKTAKEILRELEKLPVVAREINVAADGITEEIEDETGVSPEFAEKIRGISVVYEEFVEFADGKNAHLFALIGKKLAEYQEATLGRAFAEVAIKEDVDYTDAWIVRGYCEYVLQNYERALQDLRHAYEMDPVRPETHYFLALSLEKQGKIEESLLFFEKSLEHNFEFSAEVKWKLVDLFAKKQDFDRVLQLYKELVAETAEPQKYVSAVYTSIDVLQKPEIALELTTEILEKNSADILAINLHAWALIANQKYFEAEEFLEEAEDIDDTNPRTYLNFGLLFEAQEEFSQAAEYYKKSYELGKNQPYNSVTNLAADKYNELLRRERPEEPEATERSSSSP